jgi:glycine amidinotransferase
MVTELPTETTTRPVWSWNEWDPLREVIVGRLDGATIPPYHVSVTFNMPALAASMHRFVHSLRYPGWMVKRATRELEGFIALMEAEGIKVRRPEKMNHKKKFGTPSWKSRGFTIACPRDLYLVIGDEILETPGAWRSRLFEADAYRPLFKEYFRAGAQWAAAPRPELADALYDHNYRIPAKGEPLTYVITEYEPVFDAADFVRCGKDWFYILSNVTNRMGVEWLRRHLEPKGIRLHELPCTCRQPMHIDSSFIPLAPGKVMVNPDYIDLERLPPILKRWDVLVAPRPDPVDDTLARISMCSPWISMNTLSLDPKRVVCDASQPSLHKALKDWGFEPLAIPFLSYGAFGGAFHCATLDVRRDGELEDYFA